MSRKAPLRLLLVLLLAAPVAGCADLFSSCHPDPPPPPSACKPTGECPRWEDCSSVYVGVSGNAAFDAPYDEARASAAVAQLLQNKSADETTILSMASPAPGNTTSWFTIRYEGRPGSVMRRDDAERRADARWSEVRDRFAVRLAEFERLTGWTHSGDVLPQPIIGIT